MLDKEIKIVIGHKACLGAECLYCVDSCPREVLDWDKKQKKVVVVDFEQCLVCLACEEACREDGANCLKVAGCIRKEFKPTPKEDMWGGAREVRPPVKVKTSLN